MVGVACRQWAWLAGGGRGLQAVGMTGGGGRGLQTVGVACRRWAWLADSGRGLQAVGGAYLSASARRSMRKRSASAGS